MEIRPTILLAEDDANLGNLLSEYIEAKGFEITLAINGKEAYDKFTRSHYDLCILDVMMPLKDGFTLASEIRQMNKQIPIIFLTARSMRQDAIEGFKLGADDYITKPFSMEELLLRIKAVLKRTGNHAPQSNNLFEIGSYKFDYPHQHLEKEGAIQKLTSKETELLKLLCLHKNEVLDRTLALNSIWNDDSYFNSRSMDVYITKLRKYLKSDVGVEIINVHGKGFKLLVS
jgi:two-component system, OmpR family, response regulator